MSVTVAELSKVKLPKGFKRHSGGAAPRGITEATRVVCAIMTVDGVRESAPAPAFMHIWEWALHDDGFGAVVGYREA